MNAEEEKDKRGVPRHVLPILVEAPSLSSEPLVPENISHVGFRVEVTVRPMLGDLLECTLTVDGNVFPHCGAKVRWVINNEVSLSSWSVGLSIEVAEERRADFESALDAVFRDYGGAPNAG